MKLILLLPLLFLLLLAPSLMLARLVNTPRPDMETDSSPTDFGYQADELILAADDGVKLKAWFVPAPSARAIVALHGGNGNRRAFLPMLDGWHKAGFNVLLLDYRNHGESDRDGHGLTLGINESRDALAAVDYLVRERGIDKVGLIGISQGAATAMIAAAQSPQVNAVVFQSGGFDIAQMLQNVFPVLPGFMARNAARLFLWHAGVDFKSAMRLSYPPLSAAKQVDIPVLLVHGDKDNIVNLNDAEILAGAIQSEHSLWVIEGLGHEMGFAINPDEYASRVNGFFAEHL